jgi:3-oxoacyl-[acyl-carrier protein] reductase
MAAAGARVLATGRNAVAGDELAAALRADGHVAHFRVADLSESADVDALVQEAVETWGRLDAVLAIAGGSPAATRFVDMDHASWGAALATNLDSVYRTFRCAVPVLVERGGGSLVAVSSIAARRGHTGHAGYAAAKAGVVGLVRALATELAADGVRANSICPGPVATARVRALVHKRAEQGHVSEDAVRRELGAGPSGRLVTPEEVADACVFLASPQASGITGEDLNLSGGRIVY